MSSSSTVGPWSGIQPRAEWTVEASRPLDSDIRRAARPVGATSSTEAFCSAAAAQISRIVAVLPVPGPPVTIESREANAARTAAACSGAGTRSSAGGAHDALRLGGAAASSPHDLGEVVLELCGLGSVGPDGTRPAPISTTSAPASAISPSCPASGAVPSSSPARTASSATGRQVDPARSASLRTCSDSRARPRGRVGRDVERARDRVGGLEPDPEHARQVVGALAHDAVGARPVVLLDARDQPREAVRREQEMQGPARAQLVPGLDRLGDPPGAEAEAAEGGARVAVDDLEHVLAVELEQPLGSPAADVPDPLQVGEQRGLARWARAARRSRP